MRPQGRGDNNPTTASKAKKKAKKERRSVRLPCLSLRCFRPSVKKAIFDDAAEGEEQSGTALSGGARPPTTTKRSSRSTRQETKSGDPAEMETVSGSTVGAEPAKKSRPSTQELFRRAIAQAQADGDPWSKRELHALPAERVRRHRFDAGAREWLVDETLVKVERSAFDRGAMRRCFRIKKLSQQPNRKRRFHPLRWRYANNYIGKQYLDASTMAEDGGEKVTRLDVRLQQTAASFAQAFNRALCPPKKVSIIECFAVEFFERSPPEWMLVERFISGRDEYGRGFMKHNSNIGYVDEDEQRLTPQVFSAATFWLSRGVTMCTDVQGVGDLYTDPQLHTKAQSFGTGDLGRRGMAFFFQSYDARKNPLFKLLNIPAFELSPSEIRRCANAGKKGGKDSSKEWGYFAGADSSYESAAYSRRLSTATTMRRMRRAMLCKAESERRNGGESPETILACEAAIADARVAADDAADAVARLVETHHHGSEETQLIAAICTLATEGRQEQDLTKAKVAETFDLAEVLSEYFRFAARGKLSDSDSLSRNGSLLHEDVTPSNMMQQQRGPRFSTLRRWSSTAWSDGDDLDGAPPEVRAAFPVVASKKNKRMSDGGRYPDLNEEYQRSRPREALPDSRVDAPLRLALAECHAALAELECEGRFTEWRPDGGSSLFHCAKAAALGSAVAAHALGRWHGGRGPGSLAPRDALVGQTPRDVTQAGKLTILAALRGDPVACAHAGRNFTDGSGGVDKKRRPLARAFLEAALLASADPDDAFQAFIFATRPGDVVEADYACNGFHYDVRVKVVREDDGTCDVIYLEDDETETHVPWTRLRPKRTTPMTVIPPGQAGCSLPPRFDLLASLAVVAPDDLQAADYLDQAADSASRFRAPRLADTYRAKATALRRGEPNDAISTTTTTTTGKNTKKNAFFQ